MKFVRMRLKTKFLLALAGVVLVFGSINIYLIDRGVREALRKEQEKRLLFIGRNLASNSVPPILFEDIMTLQKMVDAVVNLDPDIGYCFIIDRRGQVLVHSFMDGFPEGLLRANWPTQKDSLQIRLLRSDDELYRDIAIPILSGELGIVRVSVRQSSIHREVMRVVLVFVGMVILFLILGMAGAVLAANLITRPIDKIVRVADQIDLERAPVRIKPSSRDEIGYLAVKFNQMIYRLHRLHQQVKTSQQKLIQTEKMAALGVMAAGVAHEINNPITGLRNAIRRILSRPGDKEQLERYQPLIHSALEHIGQVVQNLLWFSYQEEDRIEKVDLLELLERSLLLVYYRLEKRRISIEKEVQRNLPPVRGNPQKLQQVMVNLILNAIDAMPGGGTLRFRLESSDGGVLFSVQDTGKGIPVELHSKVFDPFFTTKQAGKGTGLGLSISYQIIQAHGGRMTFESREGEGTTFFVYLPGYAEKKTSRE